jgi:hypothetical protein
MPGYLCILRPQAWWLINIFRVAESNSAVLLLGQVIQIFIALITLIQSYAPHNS